MATRLTITIADQVNERITKYLEKGGLNNRSEFVEECIRLGLQEFEQKAGDTNGENKHKDPDGAD